MIVGIDPGRTTAMVVRRGDELVATALIEELDLVHRLEHAIDVVCVTAADLVVAQGESVDLVAVEAAIAPNAHHGGKLKLIDPAPIIGTAHLVGALVATHAATIIRPAGHGDKIPAGTPPKAARSMLHKLYPAELIGPRETTGRGKSPRQHLRAAWDIAGSARRKPRPHPLPM